MWFHSRRSVPPIKTTSPVFPLAMTGHSCVPFYLIFSNVSILLSCIRRIILSPSTHTMCQQWTAPNMFGDMTCPMLNHHVPAVSRTTYSTRPPPMILRLHPRLTYQGCPRGCPLYVRTLEWRQALHTDSPRCRTRFPMVPPGLLPLACILPMTITRIQPGRI